MIRCRLDSAFYNHSVVAAIRKAGAQFSITARMDTAVQKAVAGISEDAWVSIKYPKAIYDQDEQRWISDAQVAETTYTAFTSRARRHRVTARLIVRRVKRLNPKTAPQGQDELFSSGELPRAVSACMSSRNPDSRNGAAVVNSRPARFGSDQFRCTQAECGRRVRLQ